MDEITRKYQTLVERIQKYPMTDEARARALADVERIYRAELQQAAQAARRLKALESVLGKPQEKAVAPQQTPWYPPQEIGR
jgi:hypothetical protein